MVEIPWYKKFIGFIYPIVIAKHQNDKHTNLKIKYYQGQLQLESEDALYSDGHRYTPFRVGYNFLSKKKELTKSNNFLLLGAGLGSALHRLHKVYNYFPETYLVEYDKDILSFSQHYLLSNQGENVHFVCQEAMDYINGCDMQFDLLGIDLFDDLKNSFLITDSSFWERIKIIVQSEGNIILNTIFLNKKDREKFEDMISEHFTFDCLKRSPNYIYVMKKILEHG